jgi:hypothetical protein
MKSRERDTLIYLLQKLKREHPTFVSVRVVLSLVQSLDALAKLSELRSKNVQTN